MGLFSKFKKQVHDMDNQSLMNLSRTTRLKRDVAAVGNVVTAAAAIPSGGVSLFQGLYTVPRGLWCWKKNRIVKKALGHRGLPAPSRTKRDFIIPATVGVVTGSLGAGADAVTGFMGGVLPDATHAIPIDEWINQAGQAGLETTGSHFATITNPDIAGELAGHDYLDAYVPDDLVEHTQNGIQHLAHVVDTILPGGLPLFSERTADIAGQTVAAVAIGELAGKAVEEAAPRRRADKY
ncbi:hypothetical protein RSOL_481620 [Rhizoctonia solani AG-3 Rhs1AP]|uniref:Uncharacterized protein n=1 Tax=Rhizoctonia solani AG-3 Rhs1AP TaxID=1086054 RepID=X8JIU0_9AGAM|nr:hypothetical protein RSOL_481620 [Rhizoctonia solani AG-3 Rhs1AP]